jgi:hypothetical protein
VSTPIDRPRSIDPDRSTPIDRSIDATRRRHTSTRPTTDDDDDAHDDPDDDARGADDARARVSRENDRGSTGRARGAPDTRDARRATRDEDEDEDED